MSSKQSKQKRPGLFIPILGTLCFAIGGLFYFSARWYSYLYGSQSFNSILVTLLSGIGGVDSSILHSFLLGAAAMTLLCTAALALWCCHRSRFHLTLTLGKHTITLSPVRPALYLTASLLTLVLGFWQAARIVEFPQWLADVTNASSLLEEEYVDPNEVSITFPEKKRNLIYILLESMETTFFSQEQGGAMEQSVIPELYRLAEENLNFSEDQGVGGCNSCSGTYWTTGAIVAQASGLPLLLPYGGNQSDHMARPLEYVTMLWDILKQEGYYQAMMMGSDKYFSGRLNLMTGHGFDHIYDWNSAQQDGIIPQGYKVFWGLEDSKLFAYARQELPKLAAREEPFQFTLLTVDTHMPDGYLCDSCPNTYAEQYENVFACSSSQVAAFVRWLQEQPFYEDTTVIICGDHLSMDKGYFERAGLTSAQRRIYNCVLNSAVQTEHSKNRQYNVMDLFPTTLAAMGCTIEGERLGLGTNLLSGEPTLTEIYGRGELNQELKRSTLPYLLRFLLSPEQGQWLKKIFPNLE